MRDDGDRPFISRRKFAKYGALMAGGLPRYQAESEARIGYEPTWDSLDSRPNPSWFDDDKIGILLHWSVFSVPAVAWVYPGKRYGSGGHSCWYGLYIDGLFPLQAEMQARFEAFHRKTYGNVTFRELAPLFKAEAYDPADWAVLFRRSGARWAVLTSNFHDGFCTWPSPYNPGWNSVDVGPKRDLLGEFTHAMRAEGLRSGFYYSLGEFNHPLYPKPEGKKPDGNLGRFVREHAQPQLREAVERYSPSFIYFDGEWHYPEDAFEMKPFLSWLFTESPCRDDVVVNDRFFFGSRGRHGGVYSSEAGVRESAIEHKWIEDRPLSMGNWSYNRLERFEHYLGERDMIHLLVQTVAEGGNIHWALSPHEDGTILMLQQERLLQVGAWLEINGEAIYGTRKWRVTHEGHMVETNDPHLQKGPDNHWMWVVTREIPMVYYTKKNDLVYAIVLAWPGPLLKLEEPAPGPSTEVRMLGYERLLQWRREANGITIEVPQLSSVQLKCQHAWVFRLAALQRHKEPS